MIRLKNLAMLAGIAIFSAGAQADYKAPAADVMLLPQFCWGQYNSSLNGPQYHIKDCGPGMNHYCPTLISYNHANRIGSRGARERELKNVLREIEYTLRWMKDYPACPIRSHVEKTYSRVRVDLGLPPVITQAQPASIHVPATSAAESDAVKGVVSKGESGSGDVGKQEPSSHIDGTTQPSKDGETKSLAPEKIGTPTNPWCRFCPDPPEPKSDKQ